MKSPAEVFKTVLRAKEAFPYLPQDRRILFRDYVVQRMIEETLQDDGTCFETFRRINLTAEK